MICGTVCGTVFSDHKLVSFDIALLCSSIKPHFPARRCDIINPSTAVHFSAYFNQNFGIPKSVSLDTEKLRSWMMLWPY